MDSLSLGRSQYLTILARIKATSVIGRQLEFPRMCWEKLTTENNVKPQLISHLSFNRIGMLCKDETRTQICFLQAVIGF